MKKEIYHSIDLAKFFFCICIIALHTFAFEDMLSEKTYWYVDHLLYRLAVPFFFVSSGFMIGSKILSNPLKTEYYIKKYMQRLAIPLIVFQIVNIILESVKFVLIYDMTLPSILMRVVQSIIFYPYGALWYIQSSIVAIGLLYLFIKKGWMNQAIAIGIGLYGFALICNSYYFLTEGTILQKVVDIYLYYCVSARNGVFVGFLFLGLGIWLSNVIENLNKNNKLKYSVVGLFISFITLITEVSFVYGKNTADDNSLFISLIVLTPSLLLLLTCIKFNISDTISVYARNLSTGMYFLHRPVLSVILIASAIGGYTIPSMLTFILVLLICMLICVASYKYEIKPVVNWIK